MQETLNDITRHIDISCVRAFHPMADIDRMLAFAKEKRFACVFTLPAYTEYVVNALKNDTDIHAGGVVSFPSGGDTISSKARQAYELREMGCQEIDMVMNLTAFLSQDYLHVIDEIQAVVEHAVEVPVKVIVEAPSLTEIQLRKAVDLCILGNANFVKTSTGWYDKPTLLEHIQIMNDQAKGRIKLKAAGGIRTLEDILSMKNAGCERFGMSLNSSLSLYCK